MKFVIISTLILLTVFITGCSKDNEAELTTPSAQEYYTCPMHPEIVQDEPGDCPICGMDLVLGTRSEDGHEHSHETGSELEEGYLTIDPVVVQNMGIRVVHAEKRVLQPQIRTFGRLQTAEDKSFSVNLKYSGWIEQIWADKTGEFLNKNEILFEIYSPQLIAAQEEYLNSVNTYGEDNPVSRSAQKKLLLWDVPEDHLQTIVNENNARKNLIVRSPGKGFIMHKTVQAGSTVKAGSDLYHISDLSSIWVMAEVYENQTPFIQEGQEVEITITNIPGRTYSGSIDYIYPVLEDRTRTQKLRIVLNNQDFRLKPGMYANVIIYDKNQEERLTIPSSAVIRNGNEKLVFVGYDIGKYKAHPIETGLYDDSSGQVEVISGLQEGDLVVTSGQFLLDSESQLREAVEKLLAEKLQIQKEADLHDHSGGSEGTYFTCPMHPNIVEDEPGDCPICGMDLIEKEY